MSYSIHAGPFFVGLVTSSKTTSSSETTLTFDEFRTSNGEYPLSTLTTSGLAYTDMTSNRGTGARPYSQHAPKSGSGYGTDLSRAFGGKGSAGSIGCANLSNENVQFVYKGYDSDTVITTSNIYII